MKNLSKKLSRFYPDLPWNNADATRIVIVHHYDSVDFVRIYDIAKNDLPPLKIQLKNILNDDA